MLAANQFLFLNEEGELRQPSDWNNSDKSKLWLYNLHYFDDLRADGSKFRTNWHRALISRWIIENPAPIGNGWEPYPLSLRIVNWIKWALAGNPMKECWLNSLALQTRVLDQRLEWHLLGNHLIANAKALVFAGLFFEGPEAESWLKNGLNIFHNQLPIQILSDGGHFELSTMYHSIVLEDILDIINLIRSRSGRVLAHDEQLFNEVVPSMLDWLVTMSHPDGGISFFNDATLGVAPNPLDIIFYAKKLGFSPKPVQREGVTHLKASGYIRVQMGEFVALIDVASIGPDFIPGHAHADTLSFELSIRMQRVIVNSGISRYGTDQQRLYERSTNSHSTVEVNGTSSSEVWSGFRVARRARPFKLKVSQENEKVTISCSHNGYKRLLGKIIHRRIWELSCQSFSVTDLIDGEFDEAISRYFFHPNITLTSTEKLADNYFRGKISFDPKQELVWQNQQGFARILQTEYFPGFGLSEPNICLEFDLTNKPHKFLINW